jgi:plasmid stabilization system protein ParE
VASALWTPRAQRELDEILYYVSVLDGRPLTGERLYLEIRQQADEYARPGAARYTHPNAPSGWHYFRHKRWLIFYRPHAEGIEVMRIVDGSRDLPSVLS